MKALSPRAQADRPELIFSAQPNALKRWQRAYYKVFLQFLPGLWADSRRSFPSTQLAFSIWVPGPLLPPYSQNTHSSHRNPSNSKYIRAAQLMASLSAQPPRMSARETGITGLDKPICPTAPDICSRNGYHRPQQAHLPNRPDVLLVKRVSQSTTSLFAQPPGHTSLPMGTHKLSITDHFSQKSRRRTKLSLGSSARRLLMPVLYSGISIQCLNLQPSGMVSGSLSK